MTIESVIDLDEINEVAVVLSTVTALERALRATPSAQRLSAALAEGAITSDAIRDFVDRLMQGFTPGMHFVDEPVLCFLAVVLRDVNTPFATEYLNSLAEAKVAELPMASRIAQQCLQQHRVATGQECLTPKEETACDVENLGHS